MSSITNIEVRTAKNGARYALYTLDAGRGCSLIPRSITTETEAAAWLIKSLGLTPATPAIGDIIADAYMELVGSKHLAALEAAGLGEHAPRCEKMMRVLIPQDRRLRRDITHRMVKALTAGWSFDANFPAENLMRSLLTSAQARQRIAHEMHAIINA